MTTVAEVKIVSRWDHEKVLYVATGAADVKAALEEAGSKRANLQGANLRRANLQGANLRRANLQGANLQGANLQGANLPGADLQGADLQGANLPGADLQGADLQGADLQGANLPGADLQGADLQGADLQGANLQGANLPVDVWSGVVDILTRALSEISITGHWIKGSLSRQLESGEQAYCAIGAVQHSGEGTALAVATWLLHSVSGGSIEAFNDHSTTTLEDVKLVFNVAIIHAKRWSV